MKHFADFFSILLCIAVRKKTICSLSQNLIEPWKCFWPDFSKKKKFVKNNGVNFDKKGQGSK